MLLSTNTATLVKLFDVKTAIRLIAEAGFDAYDMSYCDIPGSEFEKLYGDESVRLANEIRKYTDDIGIICNQAHAPLPSSRGDDSDAATFEKIVRSIESAAILGAKNIIVHPMQHLNYSENKEKLRTLNIEFYSKLARYGKEFGINIAVENMYQLAKFKKYKIVPSTCSDPKEFCDYIDSVGSEYIVGCLDVGHAMITDVKPEDAVRALGSKRLRALHIHDVDGIYDLHELPFSRDLDFDALLKALAEIDYSGDFTFECDCYPPEKTPKELRLDALKYQCAVGRYLISEFNKYRSNI